MEEKLSKRQVQYRLGRLYLVSSYEGCYALAESIGVENIAPIKKYRRSDWYYVIREPTHIPVYLVHFLKKEVKRIGNVTTVLFYNPRTKEMKAEPITVREYFNKEYYKLQLYFKDKPLDVDLMKFK